jgi:carboxylesterase
MKAPLGVLILHGFMGSRATVEAVVPRAEALSLPWRLPQLRGHWTQPSDLVGVTYDDILADARAALAQLQTEAERVALVGLSMGGLLTLDLAIQAPTGLDSLVVLAPALRYVNPLARFAPLIALVLKTTKNDPTTAFTDQSLVARAGNYPTFPSATFVTVERASRRVEAALPRITTPILILGARHDRVIRPEVGQIVHDRVGSHEKQLVWFERSGHEMLLDCEADAVAERVGQFLKQRAERLTR